MDTTDAGVVALAKLVALLERHEADSAQREAAVSLAIHLFQIDEISKSKCIEVARAAGSTTAAFDAAIRALEDDWSGDVPPEWAQLPVPLPLPEHSLVKIAELADEPPNPSRRLSSAAHRHREGE